MEYPRTTPTYAVAGESPPANFWSNVYLKFRAMTAKKNSTATAVEQVNAFFEGHVSEETYKPYIPWETYRELPENAILKGVVDHVTAGEVPKAQVLINGHLMGVPIWGADVMKVRSLVKQNVEVAFTGWNGKYPKLVLKL